MSKLNKGKGVIILKSYQQKFEFILLNQHLKLLIFYDIFYLWMKN